MCSICVDIVITKTEKEIASNQEMVIVAHHRIPTTVGIEIEIIVIETETEIGIEEASIKEGEYYATDAIL